MRSFFDATMQEFSAPNPSAIVQPDFPMLAAPGIIKGGKLALRLGNEIVEVRGPARYLEKLFEWCQGDLSRAEISALALKTFGDRQFDQFVADLLSSGVLIDATLAQFHAARMAAGRAAHAQGQSFSELPLALGSVDGAGKEWTAAPAWLASFLERASALDAVAQAGLASGAVANASSLFLVWMHSSVELPAGIYRVHSTPAAQACLEALPGAAFNRVAALAADPAILYRSDALLLFVSNTGSLAMRQDHRAFSSLHIRAGAFLQSCLLAARELSMLAESADLAGHDDVTRVLGAGAEAAHALVGVVVGRDAHRSLPVPGWDRDFRWSTERAWPAVHIGRMHLGKRGQQEVVTGWGRDINPALAHDKALAEAVERHAYRQLRHCRLARWGEFPDMCRPDGLIRYSARQYRAAGFPFRPFDPRQHYLWVPAVDLDSGQQAWVVADCVFARSAFEPDYQSRLLTAANSSGCASGRNLQQAGQAALFEVLERDAFMRHWLAQRGGKEVRQESLPMSWRVRAQRLLQEGGRLSLQVLDLGTLPVWFAFFQDGAKRFTVVAAASGLCGETSLASLFSELEAGVYLRRHAVVDRETKPGQVATPGQHAALYGHPAYYRRADRLGQCAQWLHAEAAMALFPQTMPAALAALRTAGTAALSVDLTLPDAPHTLDGTPLVSVRVLVPHALPITFGAGRLPLGMGVSFERAARFPHPFP